MVVYSEPQCQKKKTINITIIIANDINIITIYKSGLWYIPLTTTMESQYPTVGRLNDNGRGVDVENFFSWNQLTIRQSDGSWAEYVHLQARLKWNAQVVCVRWGI